MVAQPPAQKNKTVYLFDGSIKKHQSAQFAVVDISVVKKVLQQCADPVMRLRAEYLFAQKKSMKLFLKTMRIPDMYLVCQRSARHTDSGPGFPVK